MAMVYQHTQGNNGLVTHRSWSGNSKSGTNNIWQWDFAIFPHRRHSMPLFGCYVAIRGTLDGIWWNIETPKKWPAPDLTHLPALNPLRPLFPAVSARFERPTCQASPRPHLCWWSWGSFRGALKQSIRPCRREQATTKICAQAGNPSWDGKRQATSEWLDAGAILRHCEPSLSLKKNPAKMWRFSKKKKLLWLVPPVALWKLCISAFPVSFHLTKDYAGYEAKNPGYVFTCLRHLAFGASYLHQLKNWSGGVFACHPSDRLEDWSCSEIYQYWYDINILYIEESP